MKNSDLKRFFETDASNNNEGFARLNPTGALNAPVSSNKISTGNAANGMLMAADGQGGIKFVNFGDEEVADKDFSNLNDFFETIEKSQHPEEISADKKFIVKSGQTAGELKALIEDIDHETLHLVLGIGEGFDTLPNFIAFNLVGISYTSDDPSTGNGTKGTRPLCFTINIGTDAETGDPEIYVTYDTDVFTENSVIYGDIYIHLEAQGQN